MKIISLNLHCHKEENEKEKLTKVAEYILKNSIDVCLFQEVCQLIEGKECAPGLMEDNNIYYLMQKTGYHYLFKPFKIGFGIYHEGLGILSKYPIDQYELINLTHTKNSSDWFRRCALAADIGGIHFINVHLGWSLENEPIDDQLEKLKACFTGNTILAGDFNYPDKTKEIEYLKTYLSSSHEDFHIDPIQNPTFHNELDSKMKSDNRMIDFIFHSKEIKIKSFSIEFNKEDSYVSDHSMLEIEM